MVSEYKESAIKRSDFRRSKTDPEIPKKVRKKKKKKKYKVVIKDHVWSFSNEEPHDWAIGHYTNLIGAEQALKHYKTVSYYKKFNIVIEEK